MCRILFLKGTNTKKALEYIDALYNAGTNDPYLEYTAKLFGVDKIKNKHIHGWGYLLVTKHSALTYLNGQAFFEDKSGFDDLKDKIKSIKGDFLLMLELRVTDEGHVSSFNSHPFNFVSRNGYEGYLFYNGLLDYKHLAELEKLDFTHFKKKNGTMIMGLSISKELEKGIKIKQALQAPKKALLSGYNLMCFISTNTGKYKALINAYAKEELVKDEKAYNYYKLIKKQDKDLFFAGSSVIGLYKKQDYTTMENGEILEFEIDFIDEFYFNAYE